MSRALVAALDAQIAALEPPAISPDLVALKRKRRPVVGGLASGEARRRGTAARDKGIRDRYVEQPTSATIHLLAEEQKITVRQINRILAEVKKLLPLGIEPTQWENRRHDMIRIAGTKVAAVERSMPPDKPLPHAILPEFPSGRSPGEEEMWAILDQHKPEMKTPIEIPQTKRRT
jgi:hypothetical protein